MDRKTLSRRLHLGVLSPFEVFHIIVFTGGMYALAGVVGNGEGLDITVHSVGVSKHVT